MLWFLIAAYNAYHRGGDRMVVNINKNLEYYSTFDPTKESKPMSLGNLCKEIQEEKITLPIFQTYIRWKINKSIDLLQFQLDGKAPVSPISINIIESKELAVPQVSFIERNKIDSNRIVGKYSVNDGQQRLSCNYKAYIDHEDFRCIVLDITSGKFEINNGKLTKSQIPVGKLYNKDPKVFKKYLEDNKQFQEFEVQNVLTNVRNKFLSYYYTVNYAKDLTEEEQRKWFEVLNLAGSRVPEVQIYLTEMLVKDVDFYKEYSNKFIERLKKYSLDKLFVKKTTEISIPLAALNPAYEVLMEKDHSNNYSPIASDAKASIISKLRKEEILNIFGMTLAALDKSIEFIEDNNLKSPSRIDYIAYLLGLFVYLGDRGLGKNQIHQVIKWYNEVDFSNQNNGERRNAFDKLIRIVYSHDNKRSLITMKY